MDDVIFVKSSPRAKSRFKKSQSVPPKARMKALTSPKHFGPVSDPIDLASSPPQQIRAATSGPMPSAEEVALSAKEEAQTRLEYVAHFLAREKQSMEDYIAKLEKSLCRKHDGLIIGDDFLHKRIAILQAQKDRQKAFYKTETEVLRQRKAEAEKAAVQGRGADFDDEMQALRKVKADLEGRVAVLDNQNLSLRAEVASLTKEVQERDRIEEEREAASAHNEHHDANLWSEIDILHQQNAALQTDKDTLEDTITHLTTTINTLQNDISNLESALHAQNRASPTPLHQRIFTLEAEKAVLEGTITDLTSETHDLRASTSQLKSDLRAQKKVVKTASKAATAQTPPPNLAKHNKRLERKVKASTRHLQTLQTAHAALQLDLAATQKDMTAQHASLTQHNTTLEKSLRARSARVIELSRALETATLETREVRRAHDALVRDVAAERERNGVLGGKVEGLGSAYRALYRQNGKLVKKLVRKTNREGLGREKTERKVRKVERLRGVELEALGEFSAT